MNNKFQVGDLVRVLVKRPLLAPYNSVGLVLGLGVVGPTYVTVLVDGERLHFTPDELTKIGETNEL